MSAHLGDVLKKLGWHDGFQIPIASDENKALEKELASLTLKKTKAKNALDVVSGRLGALNDHFKFVRQEQEQNQRLVTAHKQQLESTESQFHVSKAEKENTSRSIKQFTKQLCESDERADRRKTDLEKGIFKADKLKAEIDWDAEALKAWEEALAKREDDNQMIKEFTKQDDMMYIDLENRRQKLQGDCAEMRSKVAKLASDTTNYELMIQRSGKVLKQQMTERVALTDRWKETVKMLQQRDNDIEKVQELIATSLELIEKQEEKLREEESFFKNEQRNNHEIELELSNLNAVNSRNRRDLNELTQHLLLLHSELDGLKRQVVSTAQSLENTRSQGKTVTRTIEEKQIQCEKFQEDFEKIEAKLRVAKASSSSAEERAKSLGKMIKNEEHLYHIFMADTEKINGLLFRSDQILLEQKDIGKALERNTKNATVDCTQLRKLIRVETRNLDRIKEVVYDMEYRIDDIEKRLYKIEGESKIDDIHSDEKEKEIQELERVLSDHKEVQHVLQIQVDRLRDEMRRLVNTISADKEAVRVLQNRCENHLLKYEIGQKQINAAKKSTQEKQVEENMLRLRITQIEKEKMTEEAEIFTLEKLRLNLDQAMKERQLEINTKKTITANKKRNLEEDKGRLKADITLRRLKIEQIQKKYHIALLSLGKDEDGEPFSVTHFKIKHAQEKFLLQQAGDELDKKIKAAEIEIVAMENTLKLVNMTNASFKNSLAPVKDDDEETQEMKILEEQLRKVSIELKDKKNELAQEEKELEELQSQMEDVLKTCEEFQDNVDKLEEELSMVKRQEIDKSEKLKRATCNVNRALKKLGQRKISQYERDFEVRKIKDANSSVLKSIMRLTNAYPEMTPTIKRYLLEYNVELPKEGLSSGSSSTYSSIKACSSPTDQ